MAQQKDKRTVAEKIDDLERGLINAYQIINNMASDLQATKEGASLLGMKTQAIIDLLAAGSAVSSDSVIANVQGQRAARMAEDVANLVAQGVLTASDTVTERSFIVGRDLAKDGSGTIVNPRIQVVVKNLDEETRKRFVGVKVGTIISTEGMNQFEVMESYTITQNTPEEAEASEEAPAEEAASS